MFEDADNFADLFRGGLPYYLLITLPILIICSSNPVLASSEFSVQRMSQFDVHGVSYGCRASALNLEAKSLYSWSTSRHCVVTRFQDLTIDQFREIRAKAGGLVLLLPEDLYLLSIEEKQHIYLLEQAIMAQEISIPVYFSIYDKSLNSIIEDISKNDNSKASMSKRESALTEIINSISANGYQIIVSGANHSPNKQSKIPILQGELAPIKNLKLSDGMGTGNNIEINTKLPLIIITAHLDTFGLINENLNNIDVALLMTIIDLFSKLHNTITTAPKFRLMFLTSESGSLLNFQGMKKWLDTNLDENIQIQNIEFVLCLDGIRYQTDSDTLFMHVSKPPKEGTHMSNFYKHLRNTAQNFGNVSVEGVHKKINLAELSLAWEHERFSMKRMPAFTLSSLKSHKDPLRTTIFKESDKINVETVQKNVKIIAEALARYIYNLNNGEIFTGSMAITQQSIGPWLHLKSTLQNNDLKNGFEKYLKNVKVSYEKPDIREPDFMLYDGTEGLLNVYSVKPAVFDLFLTFLIAAYLGASYFAILYFPHLYTTICKLSNNNKVKVN